ncbi:MAG: NAD-dependent DNA ligase LigA [Clostridiales Family XIII bacterium]|jgi:DNA ligase (NAD+)|nr:NAD-dependent DNA ligase LigA [Clostridiales Family XIII bacterium]
MKPQNEKRERMEALIKILKEASVSYYENNIEMMPNIHYDALYDELLALEAETGFVFPGSPTEQVGAAPLNEFEKERHSTPMLSLDKTKKIEDLESFLGGEKGLLSWKLDGLTIALTYENGFLKKAVTRGDGTIGEVVTENARVFENLPKEISFPGLLVLRGEAVIRYSDFEKINAEIEEESAKYKNPRNLCSGSVRQLNSKVTAKRHVRFYAFSLVSATVSDEAEIPTPDFGDSREKQARFLENQGFEIVPYVVVTKETVADTVKDFSRQTAENDMPSDGLVLLYDGISYGQSLGRTAKFPRDAIAFKWTDTLVETTLTEVEWSTSRTGLINPVAVFAPVEIEGTTVKRASLHNLSIIDELALGIGDRVRVYKANMIIPQIETNLTQSGDLPIPSTGPACGSPTQVDENGGVKSLRCTNVNCMARKVRTLSYFVGRKALNIEGLSEQTLEKFVGVGLIRERADIFKLSQAKDQIVEMEGFGARSFENLMKAIEVARNTEPARLLVSLGIPGIGEANAKEICRRFAFDWQRIAEASKEELIEIEGIGEILAENYVSWFADAENAQQTEHILQEIDWTERAEPADSSEALRGLTFVITGALETYPNREALKAVIEANGGKVVGSVSAKTDFLINNDLTSASSKNKKARELGIPILSEKEFGEKL